MLVAYGRIAHTLWFHTAPGELTSTGLDVAGAKRLDERKRVVRMLVIIVSVFAVSWFPFFTLQVDNRTIIIVVASTLCVTKKQPFCFTSFLINFYLDRDFFSPHFFTEQKTLKLPRELLL